MGPGVSTTARKEELEEEDLARQLGRVQKLQQDLQERSQKALTETRSQGPRASQADQTESKLYYPSLIKHARKPSPPHQGAS